MLSAAVLVPCALVCAWLGGAAFLALLALAAIGTSVEWLGMVRAAIDPMLDGRGFVALVAGLAYLAVAALSLAWLRADPDVGRLDLLYLLALVWATDIGAYGAGRLIGGPRLAPRISPGKTVSGALGGLLAAVLVGVVAAAAVDAPASLGRAALVSAGLGIVAQAGDLLESYAKRRCGVKDSGWLIPGHGGLLDRLDALLATAPAAALLALTGSRGVVLWG